MTKTLIALAPVFVCASIASGQCVEGCIAIHTLEGEAAGDQFGWVSNSLGDLTGDGIQDFVITAPTNDAGGTNAGRVYVYDGASGVELFQITGGTTFGWYGHDANRAGDFNADGVRDLIVGEPFAGAGRAEVRSGVDGALIQAFAGEATGDQFGFRVDGGGDFNGDGSPDILIGAPNHDTANSNAGRAYVYSSVDFSLITVIDGIGINDRFGSGVAFVGDVTGDGADDIAIGAMNAGPANGGAGAVYAWDGAAFDFLYFLNPGTGSQNFGQWFMNGEGDVDGDGIPDIYVNDFGVNRAHVFSGANGQQIWLLTGDGNGGFGIGRIISDVDGDCHADLLLAAWISSAGAPSAGKAFVYSGRTGEVLETFTHNVAGAGFGFDANGMGDVNGDGADDHLITAASDLSNRGRAYVIAGNVSPPDPGDMDDDGDVDFNDLLALLSNWGPCPPPPAICPGDFNCDGDRGFADLLTLLSNWG